jgi:hypothetical protein
MAMAACAAVATVSSATGAGAATAVPPVARLAPHLTLTRTSGAPGVAVVAQGSGFAAGVSVTVSFDGVARATGTTGPHGGFGITIHVPKAAGGRHRVRAVDARGRAAGAPFTVTQAITVSPLTIAPDDPLCDRIHVAVPSTVRVSALGFGANATLRVKLGSLAVASVTADATGSAAGSFTVPRVTAGIHTVAVSDPADGFLRRKLAFVQSFSCWTASSAGSGLSWVWDGVGWDAGVTVSLRLTMPGGTHRVVRRAVTGPHGGFGILAFSGACPAAGSYPVTIAGLSAGHQIVIKAGTLHIFGSC